jgi:tetratricopeptide (TPR) repeat protein
MRSRSGMVLALGAGLLLGGCAAGPGAPSGPVVSPTGQVYEPGIAPTNNRFTNDATLAIAQGNYQQALEHIERGRAQNPDNPHFNYLAGQAQLGLGNVDEGLREFARAQELYPAYELEIEPELDRYWGVAFNEGVNAYNAGDLAGAAAAWDRANRIYPLRAEGFLNLGVIHTQQAEYDRAIQAYRGGLEALERQPATRVLTDEDLEDRLETRTTIVSNLAALLNYTQQFGEAEALYREQLRADPTNIEAQSNLAVALARQGRTAEAQEIYGRLMQDPNLTSVDLFNVGVALFQAENYQQAAGAFRRYTEALPNSRDGWYNYANALYAQNAWRDLVPVAQRLVQLDPLNENSALILARAYRETGQNQQALRALQDNEAHPVHVEELEFRPGAQRAVINGRVAGNQAAAGSPVQLRFTFFNETGGVTGTETVTVQAPARGASARFEVVHQNPQAITYRYEVVR